MEREITTFKSFSRQVLVLFALLLLPLVSHAGEASWFCYYGNLQAYPSGAGKVYAEVDEKSATNDALGNPFSDFSTPAESVDIEFVKNTNSVTGTASAGYSAFQVPKELAKMNLFQRTVFKNIALKLHCIFQVTQVIKTLQQLLA